MISLDIASHTTPLGRVQMALRGGLLCALTLDQAFPPFSWQIERRFPICAKRTRSDAASLVKRALDAYFAGDLRALSTLPLDLGGSDFQRAVWSASRRLWRSRATARGTLFGSRAAAVPASSE